MSYVCWLAWNHFRGLILCASAPMEQRLDALLSCRARHGLHWYVVNPDNTFGSGFSWITAPKFDVETLRDIGIQHEVTVAQGYQTTVELMNATSNVKYGDDY